VTRNDTWNGEPLDRVSEVHDHAAIHYRIHDVDGGRLLAFGTARPGPRGWLDIAAHYRQVQAAHPGLFLVLREYDAEAGGDFGREVGP
jgi:hypothetical protein